MTTAVQTDASVPIIGQAIVAEGYTVALSARCQCSASGSLVPLTLTCSESGTVVSQAACPRCKMGYVIQGMQMDAQGRLTFALAVLSSQAPDS